MENLQLTIVSVLLAIILVCGTGGRKITELRTPRIVGGRDAKPGEFPFMVSLQLHISTGFRHVCGGAILDKYHVLTSSNCIYEENEEDWRVVAGVLNIFNETEPDRIEIPVDKFYLHYYFDDATLNLDIGLVRINGTFPLGTSSVNSISVRKDNVSVGDVGTAIGWGTNGESAPSVLQAVDVPLVDQDVCVDTYKDYFFNVLEGMECFGGMDGGHNVCSDDFGGPLVYDGEVAAIGSWSVGCGLETYPAVYTSVPYYYSWIQSILDQSYKESGLNRDS